MIKVKGESELTAKDCVTELLMILLCFVLQFLPIQK
jgi:hypothetical protein